MSLRGVMSLVHVIINSFYSCLKDDVGGLRNIDGSILNKTNFFVFSVKASSHFERLIFFTRFVYKLTYLLHKVQISQILQNDILFRDHKFFGCKSNF